MHPSSKSETNYKTQITAGIPSDTLRLQLNLALAEWEAGGRLNKKVGLTRYGNSHVKDKTS